MPQIEPEGSSPTQSEDRRHSLRDFPRRTVAVIESLEHRYEAQILDESQGGLGVYVGDRIDIRPGTVVEVMTSDGTSRLAEVRYVHSHCHGGFHIGLKWQ